MGSAGVTDTESNTRVTFPTCYGCERPFGENEKVYRLRFLRWVDFGMGYAMRDLCEECTEKHLQSEPWTLRKALAIGSGKPPVRTVVEVRCSECNRPVMHQISAWEKEAPPRVQWFCCEAHSRTFYNRASAKRRKNARAAARQKTCEGCGSPYTASRTDAKFCSSACRQRAYRQRRGRKHKGAL